MGKKKFVFNPFLGNFDEISEEMVVVASAPTTGVEGVLYQDSSNPTNVYYFSGGNRYLITGVLDNPVSTGSVWLSLGLANMP